MKPISEVADFIIIGLGVHVYRRVLILYIWNPLHLASASLRIQCTYNLVLCIYRIIVYCRFSPWKFSNGIHLGTGLWRCWEILILRAWFIQVNSLFVSVNSSGSVRTLWTSARKRPAAESGRSREKWISRRSGSFQTEIETKKQTSGAESAYIPELGRSLLVFASREIFRHSIVAKSVWRDPFIHIIMLLKNQPYDRSTDAVQFEWHPLLEVFSP
jgi:hypothetical protein